ncbi:MAG: M16 family metallopeptidase [bacterium]
MSFGQDLDDVNVDIPFTKFVLDNGLTLIVHEDDKAPIVAVNVWYHVGSKDEKPGRTGFAHLFEHLMFNGSEHFNDDYFQLLERLGATDLNGTTSFDRTNYFQNVPKSALEPVLWAESDRMGHMLGAIDQDKLEEQRGVVINEKKEGLNQPYGKVSELIFTNAFPTGHPYSWTPIGSIEDLEAATLEDVKVWFNEKYGAANAVISIAGDVKAEAVKAKVEKYFGDVAPGPTVDRHEQWIAKREGKRRVVAQDRVPQAMMLKIWNIPEWGSEQGDYLSLVGNILSTGKMSRLYKRLVYDEQLATSVSSFAHSLEIAGLFGVQVMARPGQSLDAIEQAIDEEMAKFLSKGPTPDELERVKTQYVANFVRGIERIGGFGGKSDILAKNEVYANDPGYYKVTLNRMKDATITQLHEAAKRWLSSGQFVLEVHPFPEYQKMETDVDRSQIPETGEVPAATFPEFERVTLDNGMTLILCPRKSVPVVQMRLLVDAGYAADQTTLPGVAGMTMEMLDEGTKNRDSLQISTELLGLGVNLSTGANTDQCYVTLNTLKPNLREALDIYADVILNPQFPATELERQRKNQLASIQQEKSTPRMIGYRVFPKLIYGEGHAYNIPFTGSGTEESVQRITADHLVDYHATWFKPNNATLVIVGDVGQEDIVPKIKNAFAAWKPGDVPSKNLAKVERSATSKIYLIDRPTSRQSVIMAGHVAPPKDNPHEIAVETMNHILGGSFTSRINMNLREDKHWSYGARSMFLDARGQRPFFAYAAVQSDKTKESIQEIQKELTAIAGEQPPTNEEIERAKKNKTLKLAGQWETIKAVASSLGDLVRFDLEDNYYDTYASRIKALNADDLARVAEKVIHPKQLIWVVVGDREQIEPSLNELGYDEIVLLDADGNVVEK